MSVMDTIKSLFSRFLKKTARTTANKVVDNAATKTANVATAKINKKVDAGIEKKADEVEANVDANVNTVKAANEELAASMAKLAAANANKANAAAAGASGNLNDINTMMSYFKFGPGMEVVGVKDDAPEWVKEAYANGAFEEKK